MNRGVSLPDGWADSGRARAGFGGDPFGRARTVAPRNSRCASCRLLHRGGCGTANANIRCAPACSREATGRAGPRPGASRDLSFIAMLWCCCRTSRVLLARFKASFGARAVLRLACRALPLTSIEGARPLSGPLRLSSTAHIYQ